MAGSGPLRTVSLVRKSSDTDLTLRAAALRSLRIFSLIAVVGFSGIAVFVFTTDDAPVATVVKRDIKPIPVQAPNRPSDYPDELPTIDNVSLIEVSPEPGIIVVHLATPSTPADAVQSVTDGFDVAGWETTFAAGATLLAGSATLDETVAGVTVFPDEYKGSPKGWTTILIYLAKDPDFVDRVLPQPMLPSGPKG